ncbi:MAG: hypothetical protein AAFN77_04360 [Planctomycetota bacterium]
MIRIISVYGFLVLSFAFSAQCTAFQDLEMIRKYPPGSLNLKTSKNALVQIEWQSAQLEAQLFEAEKIAARKEAELDQINSMIGDLNQTLPIEVRFVDQQTRSRLVGRVLEQLLDAKLDLAAKKISIAELEKRLAKSNKQNLSDLRKREAEIDVRAAERTVAAAKNRLVQQQRLHEKGFISKENIDEAQFELDLELLKLEKVKTSVEIMSFAGDESISSELVQLRTEIAPIQARIEAAENYLQVFKEAAATEHRINELSRKSDMVQKSLNINMQFVNEARLNMLNLTTLETLSRAKISEMKPEPPKKSPPPFEK